MPRRPVIGITPTPNDVELGHGTFHRYTLADTYTKAIEAAGGLPLIIPPQANALPLLDILDGLLFSGGGDIDPKRYGAETIHPTTYGVDAERDDLELSLLKAALDRDLPIFCICRGIQVLNVALGGDLYQDVADEFGNTIQHRQQVEGIPKEEPGHSVQANADSLLARTYESTEILVNSFHHQAIHTAANGLSVVARSSDGSIEGVEMPDQRWVLGVQWHPEMMFRAHPEHLRPFAALVEASSSVPAVG